MVYIPLNKETEAEQVAQLAGTVEYTEYFSAEG